MPYLWVALGGAIGAVARYALALGITERFGSGPLAIFGVNVSGAFLIGFIMALTHEQPGISPTVRVFLATGILGGYTTFSTWVYDTHFLIEAGEIDRAALNIVGSTFAGLLAVWLGVVAGRAV
jgi:CrcB protein